MKTRPTPDRVREAFFSIVSPQLAGARVLDLYAGSGAIGIEALSRGASRAVFVESDPEALVCLEANIATLGLQSESRLVRQHWPRAAADLRSEGRFHLAYADPPFEKPGYPKILSTLAEAGLLEPMATVVLEHETGGALPEEESGLKLSRVCTYGRVALAFYML